MITEVSDARLAFLEELLAGDVVVGNRRDVDSLSAFLRRLELRDWKDFSMTFVRVPGPFPASREGWKYAALFHLSASVKVRRMQRRFNRTRVEVLKDDIFVAPVQRTG